MGLCSDTYPKRLWCIWELYTVFSFSCPEEALRRVVFAPFGNCECESNSSLEHLKNFKVDDAHCYDPNEEAKIRMVIKAKGADHFESIIRRLAMQLADEQKRSCTKTA